jgi:hypothetical protein
MLSLRPSAVSVVLHPELAQPLPAGFTTVFVFVRVMSRSGVAWGAEVRAEAGSGVMGLGR